MSAEGQLRIIYEETLAAVGRQFSEVEEVRGAAARALGVIALVAAVVGNSGTHGLGSLAWPVIALIIVVAAIVVFVWWPRGGWKFDIDAKKAIDSLVERKVDGVPAPPLPLDEVLKERALHLKGDYDTNRKLLDRRKKALRWVIAIAALTVVLILISIPLGEEVSQQCPTP
jgi:hypothetical protein